MDTVNGELGCVCCDIHQSGIIVEKDITLEKLGKCVGTSGVSYQQQMVSAIIGDYAVNNPRIRVEENCLTTLTSRHINQLICRDAIEQFKTAVTEELNPPLMRPIEDYGSIQSSLIFCQQVTIMQWDTILSQCRAFAAIQILE